MLDEDEKAVKRIKIKIYDDKKCKHQSFEAWIDNIDCERGYGFDKDSAVNEYELNLGNYMADILKKEKIAVYAYGAICRKDYEIEEGKTK